MNNLRKFRKFSVSSIFRFGDVKEVWYKDWKMSLYKPGQVRACFWWITEILYHSAQDFLSRLSFLCGFFQRQTFCQVNFVHILEFFSVKFEHIWNYCGMIGIKIQISTACLEKNFSAKIRIKLKPISWLALHIKGIFRTQSNIYNKLIFCKIS